VFLVSHDRTFLDNVVTSTIAYEGDARWREFEGGVQDWLTQSKRANAIAQAKGQKGAQAFHYERSEAAKAQPAPTPTAPTSAAPAAKTRKLSYKEQRELEALPAHIAALEAEQTAIHAELADGSLYARDNALALQRTQRSADIDGALMAALERWEALGG
jgi:ATP-binding cassette subfamily F protein uup